MREMKRIRRRHSQFPVVLSGACQANAITTDRRSQGREFIRATSAPPTR